MKSKYFYIPGYHQLVFCHEEIGTDLVLGSLSNFINDSKTSITRQQITLKNFKALRPKEIDPEKLSEYSFMEKDKLTKAWRSTERRKNNFNTYIKTATKLPSLPSTQSKSGMLL